MRTLVDPPPSQRCNHCDGELRFKQVIESTSRDVDLVGEVFVCVNCSREQVYTVRRDHNMGHLKAN